MLQRKNKFILKIFINGFAVILGFVYFFECRPMNRTLGEYLSHYMKGEYNLTHEVIELQYLSNEDKYLYIAGHDDCICDYETKKNVFEASNEEFIMDFVTDETCLFYLDDTNMVYQCTGDGKEIAKFQIKELDAKISLLYANEEDIYVMIGKKIYIYSMMNRKVKGVIEGYDVMGDDVDFERSIVDGEYLLLLSNNYTCSDYDGSVFREGTVGDYKNAKIVVINLSKKNILKEYEIMEGEVVYMDASKYACVKDGDILFYDYTRTLIEKHSI